MKEIKESKVIGLVRMVNHGEIGNLIASNFRCRLGDLYPKKDSDFLIFFESGEMPTGVVLSGLIAKHFADLGYTIENPCALSGDLKTHMMKISIPEESPLYVLVVIMVDYPQEPGNVVRVFCLVA